jgi:cytochrome c-type biogenesis protein CcmH
MLKRALSSRTAWAVLAVAAAALLAVGSYHPAPTSAEARISQLDSLIKCPGCEDLSLAQSQAASALALKAEVANWVHEGWSSAEVEQAVVARYGASGLLVPPRGAGALLYAVPIALISAAALVLLAFLWRRRRGSVAAAGRET